MAEKRKINIVIDGRNFTVVGSETDEYVKALAKYVDKKIKELANKNDRLCQTSTATLAALNIADELYKTKEILIDLENQAKEPMEKYDDLNSELEISKESIKSLEKENIELKSNLLSAKMDNESMDKQIKKYEQALAFKEKELLENQKMIKSLQDKIFSNQIDLIEVKKELKELKRKLDSEKQLFAKEEV